MNSQFLPLNTRIRPLREDPPETAVTLPDPHQESQPLNEWAKNPCVFAGTLDLILARIRALGRFQDQNEQQFGAPASLLAAHQILSPIGSQRVQRGQPFYLAVVQEAAMAWSPRIVDLSSRSLIRRRARGSGATRGQDENRAYPCHGEMNFTSART